MKYFIPLLCFGLCFPVFAAIDGESISTVVETDPVWTAEKNSISTNQIVDLVFPDGVTDLDYDVNTRLLSSSTGTDVTLPEATLGGPPLPTLYTTGNTDGSTDSFLFTVDPITGNRTVVEQYLVYVMRSLTYWDASGLFVTMEGGINSAALFVDPDTGVTTSPPSPWNSLIAESTRASDGNVYYAGLSGTGLYRLDNPDNGTVTTIGALPDSTGSGGALVTLDSGQSYHICGGDLSHGGAKIRPITSFSPLTFGSPVTLTGAGYSGQGIRGAANYNNIIYAIDITGGAGAGRLITIDPVTGVCTLIGGSGKWFALDTAPDPGGGVGGSYLAGLLSADDKEKLDGIEDFATADQNASEVPYSNATSGLTSTDVQAAIDEVALSGGGGGDNLGDHTATQTLDMNSNPIANASSVGVTGTGNDIVFYSEDFTSVNLVTKGGLRRSEPEIVTDDETWQYSDFDPNIWQNIGGVLQVSFDGTLADNGSTAQGYGPATLSLNLKERGFRRDHGALNVSFDYTHSRLTTNGDDVLSMWVYLLKYGENAVGSKNLSNLAAGRAGNMWMDGSVNGDSGGLDYNWHIYNMTSSDGSLDPAAPDGNFTALPAGHRLQSYQIPLTTLSESGTVNLTFDLSNLDLSGGPQTLPVVNSLYTTGDAVNDGEYEIVNAGGNVDSFMGTPSLADFDYIQVAFTIRDNQGSSPSIVLDATATIDNLELTAVSTAGNLELTGVGASEEFTVVKTLNANVAEPITDFNAEGIIRVPVDQYPVVKYVQTGNIEFQWFSTVASDLSECVVILETDAAGSAIDFGTVAWAEGSPPAYGTSTVNMFHVRVHNGVVKAVDIGEF